jgi:hypothetical protein
VVAQTTTRIVFLEESIHFINAGGPVLNEMETMMKNDIVVYRFHSIN